MNARGQSLRINTTTGVWHDFATGDGGRDLTSLHAAIHHMSQGDSARELAERFNFTITSDLPPKAIAREVVIDLVRAPNNVPTPDGHHYKFGRAQALHMYNHEKGYPLYVVARYEASELTDGKKQFVPWSYSLKAKTWVSRALPDERPLYGLDVLAANPDAPVLIVEGEKAVHAVRLISGLKSYVCTTWSGGSQAMFKTDWTPLTGRKILLWPDADSVKLGDRLRPYEDQPGYVAMSKLGTHLWKICPEVKILDVSGYTDGWDAADAAFATVTEFMNWARPRVSMFTPPKETTATIAPEIPLSDEQLDAMDIKDEEEDLGALRVPPSVMAVVDACQLEVTRAGPTTNMSAICRVLKRWPAFKGFVWFDEFHNKIFTNFNLAPGQTQREWCDYDDLELVHWLQEYVGMRRATNSNVRDAVIKTARIHTVNEPKDWMNTLVWDGQPRLNGFFSWYFMAIDNEYTTAISKNFWIAMVKRIYEPGCKVDNMIVLEGRQGKFKSTALAVIGGKWFAEATEAVTSKDFYLLLQGKLLIEIAELDAFSRAETNTIKKVVSQQTDRFRPPYGRAIQDHPRTSCFCGTTNEDDYLRDPTGGRRFWPLKIGDQIDIDALKRDRDQLFAEAVVRYRAGETHWEVPQEFAADMQAQRTQIDEWSSIIGTWLTGKTQILMPEVARGALKIEAQDLSIAQQRRINQALKANGFTRMQLNRTRGSFTWIRDGHGIPIQIGPLSETATVSESPTIFESEND